MAVSAAGLAAASGPSLSSSHATAGELVMATLAMALYSIGAVYRTWSADVVGLVLVLGGLVVSGTVDLRWLTRRRAMI